MKYSIETRSQSICACVSFYLANLPLGSDGNWCLSTLRRLFGCWTRRLIFALELLLLLLLLLLIFLLPTYRCLRSCVWWFPLSRSVCSALDLCDSYMLCLQIWNVLRVCSSRVDGAQCNLKGVRLFFKQIFKLFHFFCLKVVQKSIFSEIFFYQKMF